MVIACSRFQDHEWGENIAVEQVQINLDVLVTVFLFTKRHAFLSFLSRTTSQVQPELQKQKSQIPLCCSKLRRFWAKSSLITWAPRWPKGPADLRSLFKALTKKEVRLKSLKLRNFCLCNIYWTRCRHNIMNTEGLMQVTENPTWTSHK